MHDSTPAQQKERITLTLSSEAVTRLGYAAVDLRVTKSEIVERALLEWDNARVMKAARGGR